MIVQQTAKANKTKQQKLSNILPQRRQLRSSSKILVGKGQKKVIIQSVGLRQKA